MRFEVADKTVSVCFRYEGQCESADFSQGDPRITTCTIREITKDQKTEDGIVLGQSRIVRHLNDPDNKFVARKVALSRAMANSTLAKPQRRAIWKGYLSKVRMPSK